MVRNASFLKTVCTESPLCGSGLEPTIPAAAKLMLDAGPSCGCCSRSARETCAGSMPWPVRKLEHFGEARYSKAVALACEYFCNALPLSGILIGGGGVVPSIGSATFLMESLSGAAVCAKAEPQIVARRNPIAISLFMAPDNIRQPSLRLSD